MESRGGEGIGDTVASRAFADEVINKRLREEHNLWDAIPWVPDFQAARQILIRGAGPRCHHILRTLPPSQSAEYAQRHDDGMKQTMDNLLRLPGEVHEQDMARNIASLQMGMGGLGIRSAQRMAPGAYWASLADALHMIDQRPVNTLIANEHPGGRLGELRNAAGLLDRHGFVGRPDWNSIRGGSVRKVTCRTWGVATRLAILRFFFFRTPLQEERSVEPVVRC